MVPNPALSITSQTTGSSASIAVAITDGFVLNPPSPISATAARSGCAILTPMTADGPKPIVASPLGVMNVPGTVIGNCWPTPFLFQPTSVTMKPSSGTALPQFRKNPFRPQRKLVRVPLVIPVRGECLAASGDLVSEASAIAMRRPTGGGGQGRQRELRVGDDAQLGRVVPADLRLVRVDVNQTRRRNRERETRIPRARIGLGEARPNRDDQIGGAAFVVRNRRAPEPGLSKEQGMVGVQAAFAHQCVRDRHFERFGKSGELRRGTSRHHAAARVEERALRGRERVDDVSGDRLVDRGTRHHGRNLLKGVDRQILGEQVHWHIDEDRTRTSRLTQMKRALHHARQIADAIDTVDALTERLVNLELIGVPVKVHFLMRMAAVIVRRHVARNDHHGDRIERRIGDTGAGVGQAWSEMRQENPWLAGCPRVPVGCVRGDLFVPRRHKPNPALPERVEECDDRMTAETKHDLDAKALEVIRQQVRGNPCLGPGLRSAIAVVAIVLIGLPAVMRRSRCCRTRRTGPARTADPRASAG